MFYIDNLSSLCDGEEAQVVKLLTRGTMRRRLQDIGLIANTKVKCLQKSPSKDPVAYMIRGAVIALRNSDAQNVIIKISQDSK